MRGPNRPKPLTSAELRALAMIDRFRLLTFDQGVRLGLGRTKDQVRNLFRVLVNAKLVGIINPRDPNFLQLQPYTHYLKPAGAERLEAEFGTPCLASKRRQRSLHEGAHRRGIVDVHIALRAWVRASNGWTLETFTTDFEPGSGPGQKGRWKATTLDSLRGHGVQYPPDAKANLRDASGELWGILFEYERGDVSRFRRKKLPLLREISGGTPRDPAQEPLKGYVERDFAEGMRKAVRFAIVFEDEARRDRALAGWPDRTSPDWRRFFIKALPELQADFNGGWWQPDGTQRPLFLVS